MKTARKSLAILLSLLLLVCSFSTALFVSAESGEAEDLIFNASEDFSLEQNPNGVWRYQYRHNNGGVYTYTDLPYESATNLWRVAGTAYIGTSQGDQVMSNDKVMLLATEQQADDAVVTFTAPYSGIITVKMTNGGVFSPYQNADAVRFSMMHNDIVIKSADDLDAGYNGVRFFSEPISLTVTAGDTIRFTVGRNFDVNATTLFNPEIAYSEVYKTAYNAVNDFSFENNPNGVWGYQYAHDTGSGFAYGTLGVINIANQWDTAENYGGVARIGIANGDQVTSATDPVVMLATDQQTDYAALTFTAPYTGTVNIRMANGGVFSPFQNRANVRFRLIHNNNVIKSIDDLDSAYGAANRFFGDTVALDVVSGDVIAFAVSRNNPDEGTVYCNPEVSYTSLVKDSFRAVDEYSTQNNPSGFWSYQYRYNNGNGYTYTNIGFDSSINQWSGGGIRLFKDQGDYVTSMTNPLIRLAADQEANDAVVTFTAPYSGTVNISMGNGGVYSPFQSSDGVRFNMMLNDDAVITVNDLDNAYNAAGNRVFEQPQVLNVKAGDKIRFTVGRNLGIDSSTYIDPIIKYTSIEEVTPVTGRAFYFSNSVGNDNYIGTNSVAPWKSFAKLADLELKAGDRVYLKAGDVWNDQLVINGVSAAEEDPCMITSYGEGALPKINLQLTDDPDTEISELAVPAVLVNNAEGLEIRNLDITGTGIGIDLHYDDSFNNEYVKIADCTFEDLTGFHQSDDRAKNSSDRYYVAGAVTVTVTNTCIGIDDPALIGLYIDNCTSVHCGTLFSIASYPYYTNEGGALGVNGLYITDCVMKNNTYYGTIVAGAEGGYIDGCIIDNCGTAEYYAPGTAGIMISTKDYAIINTEIQNQQRGGVNYDGVGIDFEWNCENILVDNCYLHGNTGSGIFFYDSNNPTPGTENRNITVKNCVFEENATEADPESGADDPIADIRITARNRALINSVIRDNIYYNSREGYSFVADNQNPEGANNIIEEPIEDIIDTFIVDAGLSETVKADLSNYNNSNYNVDKRVGYQFDKDYTVSETYKYSEAFGASMNEWSCKYYADGWYDMTFDNNVGYWVYGLGGAALANGVHPANSGTPVITFTAPKSGRVRLSMEDIMTVAPDTADGVVINVLNGNKELIADPIVLTAAAYSKSFSEVFVNVTEGENIYFCVSKHDTNMSDFTSIKPVVEYVQTIASINGDASIDIIDLVYLVKGIAEGNISADAADFDGDGIVGATDIVILRKYLFTKF